MTAPARRLHLLRHAKSSWDVSGLPDRERPLAPRGRRAVEALRRHFAATALRVDLVVCSPAQRTRETWAGVAPDVAGEPRVEFEELVYAASVGELLMVIREVDAGVGSLLLIGHNPGFEVLAHTLVDTAEDAALDRLRDGYPTAGFATFDIAAPWSDVRTGSGHLADFVRPRDLDDD